MPTISRWLIFLSLFYFFAGTAMGALMLMHKAGFGNDAIWALFPVHIEFMMFGWIIQFTLGVAFWILPRFLGENPRGKAGYGAFMVFLINAGIMLVVAAQTDVIAAQFALAGRLAETAAVLLFIRLHWGRIVSYNI